jgi:hypothetical protein
MRRARVAFLFAIAVVCAAVELSAQSSETGVLPSRDLGAAVVFAMPDDTDWTQRLADLQRWLSAFKSWQQWDAAWHNRPEPGWLGVRPRRTRPDPPAWLADECIDASLENGVLAAACRAFVDWKDDEAVAHVRDQRVTARAQQEAATKSVWWEHIHLDALWPMPQWSSGVVGVLGMHATVDVAGRLQVFVAPGAIVLNLPNGRNSREWKPATDWGLAYRCFDFTIPGTDQRASVHLNLAKAWVLADPIGAFPATVDLAGFSITFRRSQ